MPFAPDMQALEALALDAGKAIMAERNTARASETTKPDGSPVTAADLAADRIIREGLAALAPEIPAITEETFEESDGGDSGGDSGDSGAEEPPAYWCVDPLDGTRGFINGGSDFTVNIALIENRAPRLGVIFAPALGVLWSGSDNGGAWSRKIDKSGAQGEATPLAVRDANTTRPDIVATYAHRTAALEAWIARLGAGEHVSVGSSLKFCMLAEGRADLYPRIGVTMEWDTAAGHAIVNAAGGAVLTARGVPLGYGKPQRRNGPFVALAKIADGDIPDDWLPPRG